MHDRFGGWWGFHRRSRRGQSLVEFALMLPLLLVLLLGVADFG
ncbi:MAG: TadE/TadG family type IV pilus assembly protein, partial [Chloroflexota bacterium]